jgi:hypothetical protein
MREQKTPVEMYYYEKAGHSFCNFNRPQGSDPGYDYVPEAANLAQSRMVEFLKRHFSQCMQITFQRAGGLTMCSTGAAEASFEWLLPVPIGGPVNRTLGGYPGAVTKNGETE